MQFPNASLVFYYGLVCGSLCICAGSLRGQALGSPSGPGREEYVAWRCPAEPSLSQRHGESREVTLELSTVQFASPLHEAFLHGDGTILMHVKFSQEESCCD